MPNRSLPMSAIFNQSKDSYRDPTTRQSRHSKFLAPPTSSHRQIRDRTLSAGSQSEEDGKVIPRHRHECPSGITSDAEMEEEQASVKGKGKKQTAHPSFQFQETDHQGNTVETRFRPNEADDNFSVHSKMYTVKRPPTPPGGQASDQSSAGSDVEPDTRAPESPNSGTLDSFEGRSGPSTQSRRPQRV